MKITSFIAAAILLSASFFYANAPISAQNSNSYFSTDKPVLPANADQDEKMPASQHLESIVLGAGCFWGAEKRYQAINVSSHQFNASLGKEAAPFVSVTWTFVLADLCKDALRFDHSRFRLAHGHVPRPVHFLNQGLQGFNCCREFIAGFGSYFFRWP